MEITAIIVCLNHSNNLFVVKCILDAANVIKYPFNEHLLFPSISALRSPSEAPCGTIPARSPHNPECKHASYRQTQNLPCTPLFPLICPVNVLLCAITNMVLCSCWMILAMVNVLPEPVAFPKAFVVLLRLESSESTSEAAL